MDAFVESIKQHPGQQQVDRAVKVNVPGKHFPGLTPSEQKQDYEGTAVEYRERYKFEKHLKAWGVAGTFPGIRFICRADAIDDPDHKGFWTTLSLWNRWRHDTYKDNRAAEVEFLDKKPEELLLRRCRRRHRPRSSPTSSSSAPPKTTAILLLH